LQSGLVRAKHEQSSQLVLSAVGVAVVSFRLIATLITKLYRKAAANQAFGAYRHGRCACDQRWRLFGFPVVS